MLDITACTPAQALASGSPSLPLLLAGLGSLCATSVLAAVTPRAAAGEL